MTSPAVGHRTTAEGTFLFVDLAGYSAASWAHGDDTAAELAIELLELAETSASGGDEVVKSIGDAVMCQSQTPSGALDLLEGMWVAADTKRHFPLLRAALHEGTAVHYQGDYFGNAVNVAARLAALAEPDDILATPAVAAVASGRGWQVERLGDRALRNIGGTFEVLGLALRDRPIFFVDPICHMRLDPTTALTLETGRGPELFCSVECRSIFRERQASNGSPAT